MSDLILLVDVFCIIVFCLSLMGFTVTCQHFKDDMAFDEIWVSLQRGSFREHLTPKGVAWWLRTQAMLITLLCLVITNIGLSFI